MDVVRGNQTLFMRKDEVEAAGVGLILLLALLKRIIDYPKHISLSLGDQHHHLIF